MRDTIINELAEIEKRENIRVIYCAEAGSRAWGFDSPDSDYDARFVYVRRTEDYLKLGAFRDVIEWKLDDTLDINGWDLRKLLRLLYNSNPVIFEWRGSPIVYRTTDLWEKNAPLFDGYFSERAAVYHYLNTARNHVKSYLTSDTVKLKRYFYTLRSLWACRWVIEKKSPPPVPFEELFREYCPGEFRETVSTLLEKKRAGTLGSSTQIWTLTDYSCSQIDELTQIMETYEKLPPKGWGTLDRIFLESLGIG